MRRAAALAGVCLLAAGCGSGGSKDWKLLFVSARDGDWALYVSDIDGRGARRVLKAPSADVRPLPSPDGRKILLPARGISIVDTAGGELRRLAAGDLSSASWSPDGGRVAFPGFEHHGLYVIGSHGSRKRNLIGRRQSWNIAWSPDGRWIAYVGGGGVFLVRPDGTGRRRLTTDRPAGQSGLAWSPDSRKIALGGGPIDVEEADLRVLDVRTGAGRTLARFVGDTPAWSPDGSMLAYVGAESAGLEIYAVRADGSHRRRLTGTRAGESTSPLWSPDGRRLVFVRGGAFTRHPDELELRQLWSMNADGSGQRALTRGYPSGGENLAPAWVRGRVRAETPPRLSGERRDASFVLRVPYPVGELSADAGRVAVGPPGRGLESQAPGSPLLVWEPASGAIRRLVASTCNPVDVTLVGPRLAFDCDQSAVDAVAQSVRLYDLRARRPPTEVFFGHNGPKWINGGVFLGRIAGDAGLLVFSTERTNSRGVILWRTIWRVDGTRKVPILAGRGVGALRSVGAGRIASELVNGSIAIVRRNGRPLRVVPVARRRPRKQSVWTGPQPHDLLLAGPRLLAAKDGRLEVYGTSTGTLERSWPLPPGTRRLEAAGGGLALSVHGGEIHVVRLADGRDATIHVRALGAAELEPLGYYLQYRVHADLTQAGLFYDYNVPGARAPGRVVFVPRAALLRRLGHG